ncbi:MAG: membrane protein [Cyclobacteriaceae bacterium]|nr:MAG: membrane protein [Cyclobacteriaceae bacterium]
MEHQETFPPENTTALCHYYRAEMDRANTWRTRLDVTTNWAIVTTAAFLSVSFGNAKFPHFVIILATIFVLFFLIIESRRYKYFDLWRWRIALLNENFFTQIVSPDSKPLRPNWREMLSSELKYSRFKISFMEAFGRRLRRNYSWIFILLGICWIAKIVIHPVPITEFSEILSRATIFNLIPGIVVLIIGILFNLSLMAIAIITYKKRDVEVQISSIKQFGRESKG